MMIDCSMYQEATCLSNAACALLAKGHAREAHDALHSAIAHFQRSFQSSNESSSASLRGESHFDVARTNAEMALYREPVCHSNLEVETVLLHSQQQIPQTIFDFRVVGSGEAFSVYPMILSTAVSPSAPSSAEVDFHCAVMIYNFALSKLCLHHITQENKHAHGGIHLLRMAFNQLSKIICIKDEHNQNDVSLSSNLVIMCAMVLNNLARALTLVSEHAEARAMIERLQAIEADLQAQQDASQAMGGPTAAAAA